MRCPYMPENKCVLVVGTTADYIEWLRNSLPGEVIFLTEPTLRKHAKEPCPSSEEEILAELTDQQNTYYVLQEHLAKYKIRLDGITCFDDEHMSLTAYLASELKLSYPSITAVKNCRNKYLSKKLWRQFGVPAPACRTLRQQDFANFISELETTSYVLKPLSGSGSELTFKCDSPSEVEFALSQLENGLSARSNHRMYSEFESEEMLFLAEEFVLGQEYSCDFIVEGEDVDILRLTKKYPAEDGSFALTAAYELIPFVSSPFSENSLKKMLQQAASAVGLKKAICMVDFIERDGIPVFLEIAPRFGGDCLPWLLKSAYGIDSLALAVELSRNNCVKREFKNIDHYYLGLRILADRAGIVKCIDTKALKNDARVIEVFIPNDKIEVKLPPEDYFSRILGHIIYCPSVGKPIVDQNQELSKMIRIEWE